MHMLLFVVANVEMSTEDLLLALEELSNIPLKQVHFEYEINHRFALYN